MEADSYWEIGFILIALEGTKLELYEKPIPSKQFEHGEVSDGSCLLTLEEAKSLLKTYRGERR